MLTMAIPGLEILADRLLTTSQYVLVYSPEGPSSIWFKFKSLKGGQFEGIGWVLGLGG